MLHKAYAKLTGFFTGNRARVSIVVLLLAVFILSVFARAKHFGKPLDAHHEWLTAHAMIILQIWDQNGIANYHYSPAYTFKHKTDGEDYTICSLVDQKGEAYYVSYGPFAFLFPYFIFKTFGIPITLNALIAYNLCIHFFISLLLYLIVLKLGKKTFDRFYLPAFTVFLFYIFTPGTLWFHSNIYFSEIFIQLLVVAGLYIVLCINEQHMPGWKYLAWYALICFTCVYTEWLGLFFVFFSALWFMLKAFGERYYWRYFIAGAAAGIAGIGLMLWQYSSIAGFDVFVKVSMNKFSIRNGGMVVAGTGADNISVNDDKSFSNIESFINDNFLNIINTLAFVIPLFVVLVICRRKYFFTSSQLLVLVMLILIVFMHHYLFFNFTAVHDFSVLKTGLLLIVLIGLMLSRIMLFTRQYTWLHRVFTLVVLIFAGIKSWHGYTHYDNANALYKINPVFMETGEKIRQLSTPAERIYTNLVCCPQLNYYARRNVQPDIDGKAARRWAVDRKQQVALFFLGQAKVQYVMRYFPNGDSVRVNSPFPGLK